MACSPNDYMRLVGLSQAPVVMHYYFIDGTYIRGYLARAELDPVSRTGPILLVLPGNSRIIQCNAGDLLKVSSRAPDGSRF